jgi:hypothetical protein
MVETICKDRVKDLTEFITDETYSDVLRGSAKWHLLLMTDSGYAEPVRRIAQEGIARLSAIPGQDQILPRPWNLG